MKAKSFVAPDMRQALKLVRDSMGADAVILSNRKVAGGVEVSVALDYDQAMIDHRVNVAKAANIPRYTNGSSQFAPPQGDTNRLLKETLIAAKDKDRREEVKAMLNRQREQLDQAEWLDQGQQLDKSNPAEIDEQSAEVSISPQAQQKQRTDKLMPPAAYSQSQPMPEAVESVEEAAPAAVVETYEMRAERESAVAGATVTNKATAAIPRALTKDDTHLAFDEPKEAESEHEMLQMRSELQQLRGMINSQLGNVAWGDFSYRHPVSAAIFKRLVSMGFTPALSRSLSQQIDSQSSKKDAWNDVLLSLSSRIPVLGASLPRAEGRIAFVGPAGVGKTTTISKLAAEYVLEHGPEDLALVTTDSYRIAGHEQLNVLSKILKVPLRVVTGKQSLESVLRGLSRKKMILIDTAGLSQKDTSWAEQISLIESANMDIQKWLVLSATSQRSILDKAVANYKGLGLNGCILTKLDESASLGEALGVVIEHQLSVAYTTNGQNIPDDIAQAKPKNLVNQAISLTKNATLDDELAADCFNESMPITNGAFSAA
ncbi:MAG: flagellar biosynthesis protein FlhF [Moraxellaceae bacterium]|nr:MAG: flagellar biosynthesis protein FlhF [Moraxellaceae bacterium]